MEHVDEELMVRQLAGELTAQEQASLEAHLDGCARCRRVAAELVRIDDTGDDDMLIGRELEGWQIQRLIGAGSFSEVFLAHHPSIDRPAAVKVLKAAHEPAVAKRL